ncbi:DUF3311 domain-containing protein [Stieleria varia]|uniref:DUF3311 domain-containing protein n=1 Tax=Stieleria varia TaxID=2528005 RepID=A0A5C6A4X7_9BACT|nr:DUF3311 domain-containing protein [Stieleria varia]TWT94529.1 hypothetical protein Pla52n_53500 [Stieleria varia]
MTEKPQQPTPQGQGSSHKGAWIIAALVLLLLILHQDNWNWESKTLVFGFMPIGLFWHACISIGASATWLLATKIAWPADDEQPEETA